MMPLKSPLSSSLPSICDHLLTAIVVLDEKMVIQYMNAAAETLLDGSSRRLVGTPFYSHFRYLSVDQEVLASALSHQQSVSDTEVEMVFHDQQRILVELATQPLPAEVLTPGAKGSTKDLLLLELRRVDQVRKINQENSQHQQLLAVQSLVRGLAHEIKNPLGGLRGAAQLLAAELPKAGLELTEYTDLIISQADRLRALVDRLLGPHRFPERKACNLHQLLEQVIKVVQLDAQGNLQVQRDYDPSLPEMHIAGDAIEQALLNMVANASEVLEGNGEILIRTRVVHQQTIYGKRYRQCAVVSIIDPGPGIPAELSDTLFYPMVSGRAGGTGLGLSIAQTAVHQHAGKIEVDSRPGYTEFKIFLPYENSRVIDEVTHE